MLRAQGVDEVIPPIKTASGDYSAVLGAFSLTVYPFIGGENGVEARLGRDEWVAFGKVLRALHEHEPPAELVDSIPREGYQDHFRQIVIVYQAQVERQRFQDAVAENLADLLRQKRKQIDWLVHRAGHLAELLKGRSLPLVLCHGDIHAYNLLIEPNGRFYLVDWDTLILAPKERDLMFLGAAIGGCLDDPTMEPLFYQGYGATTIEPLALVYYRYQRIVEDIAAYCQSILHRSDREADRRRGLRQLRSQFLPGSVIDVALNSERMLPANHQMAPKFT
jgi:spectinomycin phosphotransferase